MSHHQNGNSDHGHHHILQDGMILRVGLSLGLLTIITVAVAQVDLGAWNLLVAMIVATIKGLLVALFFMGLKYDRRENAVFFFGSFAFLVIFFVITASDLFYRGDVYVKPGVAVAGTSAGGAKSKLKEPWKASTELMERGKVLFGQNCAACHGPSGKGDGAAAASMNPPPRNFEKDVGWKNGRKLSGIFKTLKEGLPASSMGSYAAMGVDDRWAMAQYVQSLGPKVEPDSAADLAKIGIDPATYASAAEQDAAQISVGFAMERLAVADSRLHPAPTEKERAGSGAGTRAELTYRTQCASCHGLNGEGAIKISALGATPSRAFLFAPPFSQARRGVLRSPAEFSQFLVNGTAGSWHLAQGARSTTEISELYQFVKVLGH